MKSVDKVFTALCRKAKAMGSDIVKVDRIPGVYECPFNTELGLDWEHKVAFYTGAMTLIKLSGLIHELGHANACMRPPNKVSDESAFIGWEWVLAKSVGFTQGGWRDSTGDYYIHWRDYETIVDIPKAQLSTFIKEYVEIAVNARLVIANQPIAIR